MRVARLVIRCAGENNAAEWRPSNSRRQPVPAAPPPPPTRRQVPASRTSKVPEGPDDAADFHAGAQRTAGSPEQVERVRSGEWTVDKKYDKLRLDRFLKEALGSASEKFLDKAFRSGCVSLNGRQLRRTQKQGIFVKTNDTVGLAPLPASTVPDLTDEEWASRILYEDAHLLALDKPPGIASAPAPSEPWTVVSALEALLSRRDGGGNATLRNVHRLDKDTSGVLILAKTAAAAAQLATAFRGSAVRKQYFALLTGHLEGPQEGLWSDIIQLGSDGRSHILPAGSSVAGGKTAKARFTVVECFAAAGATAVRLLPTTGRLHQLRAQAAARGAPISGDDRYGNRDNARPTSPAVPRLCLHCESLELPHPALPDELLQLRAALPDDILIYADWLRAGGGATVKL